MLGTMLIKGGSSTVSSCDQSRQHGENKRQNGEDRLVSRGTSKEQWTTQTTALPLLGLDVIFLEV